MSGLTDQSGTRGTASEAMIGGSVKTILAPAGASHVVCFKKHTRNELYNRYIGQCDIVSLLRNTCFVWLNLTFLAFSAMAGVPPVATRVDRPSNADSTPVLTVATIIKMTHFWSAFMQEPDSIKKTGQEAHMKIEILDMGNMGLQTVVVDMVAMAAKYPAVAASLKKNGMSAPGWESYRDAIETAIGVKESKMAVDPASILGRNVSFFDAHPTEIADLAATGMIPTVDQMKNPQKAAGGMDGGEDDMSP